MENDEVIERMLVDLKKYSAENTFRFDENHPDGKRTLIVTATRTGDAGSVVVNDKDTGEVLYSSDISPDRIDAVFEFLREVNK